MPACLGKISYKPKEAKVDPLGFYYRFFQALEFLKSKGVVVVRKEFSKDDYAVTDRAEFVRQNKTMVSKLTHLLVLGEGATDPRVKWEIKTVLDNGGTVYYEDIPKSKINQAVLEYLNSKGLLEISYLANKYDIDEKKLSDMLSARVVKLSNAYADNYYTRRRKGYEGKG